MRRENILNLKLQSKEEAKRKMNLAQKQARRLQALQWLEKLLKKRRGKMLGQNQKNVDNYKLTILFKMFA